MIPKPKWSNYDSKIITNYNILKSGRIVLSIGKGF